VILKMIFDFMHCSELAVALQPGPTRKSSQVKRDQRVAVHDGPVERGQSDRALVLVHIPADGWGTWSRSWTQTRPDVGNC
jgi:hypothetical protein